MSIQHSGYICEKGSTHGKLVECCKPRFMPRRRKVLPKLSRHFILRKPAHVDNLVVFIRRVDSHRHVVIRGDDLLVVLVSGTSTRMLLSFTYFLEVNAKSFFE